MHSFGPLRHVRAPEQGTVKLASLKPRVSRCIAIDCASGNHRPEATWFRCSLFVPRKCSLVAANVGYFLADPLPSRHRSPGTGQIDIAGSAGVTPVQAYAAAALVCRMPDGDIRSDGARYFGPFRKVAHDRQDLGLVYLEQSAQLIHGRLVVVNTDIAERIFLG